MGNSLKIQHLRNFAIIIFMMIQKILNILSITEACRAVAFISPNEMKAIFQPSFPMSRCH